MKVLLSLLVILILLLLFAYFITETIIYGLFDPSKVRK